MPTAAAARPFAARPDAKPTDAPATTDTSASDTAATVPGRAAGAGRWPLVVLVAVLVMASLHAVLGEHALIGHIAWAAEEPHHTPEPQHHTPDHWLPLSIGRHP